MKFPIQTPLSGANKYVGFRLPIEITDYLQKQADNRVSNVAAEIRTVLVEHFRRIGAMAPIEGMESSK